MKITKEAFVRTIAKRTGLSIYRTEKVLEAIIDEIKQIVTIGNSIGFQSFGVFNSVVRAATRRRSFGGEVQEYPERRFPRFSTSEKWRNEFPQDNA